MTIAALNGLDILAYDIQNPYLTEKYRDLIWTTAGTKFSLEEVSIMVVKMDLYGLKSSGAALRSKLASLLHDIGYTPSKADPNAWMIPAIKSDRMEHYKYALVYIDDVLVIIYAPMKRIEGIKFVFKLKGDKAELTDTYLVASLEQVKTKGRTKCWSMSAKKYVKAAVVNIEEMPAKRDMRLPTSHYPMQTDYHPSEDVSNKLKARGFQAYQELTGEFRCAFEIGRVEIFLELALLSSHLALPQSDRLQAVYQIFGYLK